MSMRRTGLVVTIVIGLIAPTTVAAHGRRSDHKLPGGLRAHWQHSATVLVGPDGQLVGGKWQRWVDQARTPTIHGPLTFTTDVTACGGAMGCSWGPPYGAPPYETAVTSGVLARNTLYFELGHQFDWQRLTDRDRRFLARLWGVPRARWEDSERGLEQGAEDGLEADFAGTYASCAWGQFEVSGLVVAEPDRATVQAPGISTTNPTATCRFIDRVGARHYPSTA